LATELKRETRRSLELTHKNIVRIYDFVQSESSACISMEYIDGDTLSNLRAEKEQKVFQPEEIAAWTSQLCDALDYAHNHARIIHRDLKPANLMVNQRGDLKVSDFGIARSLGDSMSKLTLASGTSGTLVYMSPQQLEGERGTHFDDIYSLGATLYDLLTSKPPFYSGNLDKQIHERTAPSMTERRREFNLEPALVPPLWEETVAACLAKDPAQRPQSAAECAERLHLSATRSQPVAAISAKRPKRWALWIGLAAFGLIALAGFYFARSKPTIAPALIPPAAPSQAPTIPEKSIAVLPFENLSAEKDDAFFADGIQDDVLTSLGKIKDLTVIARGSVLPYRGEAVAGKLREIGQALGVAHILQGSVRRLANRVVVNVQLIDARSDRQLWTERYERTMTDALSLQGELAVEIARELRASLTPLEQQAFATKPTGDPDAYLLYLRARELEIRFRPSEADGETAVKLYQQAVDLDPAFALARARLSMMSITAAGPDGNPTPALKAKALAEAEEAFRLRPGLGEARLALAYYYYFGTEDFDRALTELSQAETLLPNSAEVWQTRGTIYRRQNKFREFIAALRRAETLDPRDTQVLWTLAPALRSVREWTEAARTRNRIAAILPHLQRATKNANAFDEFRLTGNVEPLKQLMGEAPTVGDDRDTQNIYMSFQFEFAMIARDFDTAERLLRELPEDFDGDPHFKAIREVLLAVGRGGDRANVERTLISARQEIEKLLAASPNVSRSYGKLGLIDAFLGRKDDAIRAGRQAVETASSSLVDKNEASAALALIYAWSGESEQALELIEHLLTVPARLSQLTLSSITVAELKWRWLWDPLRNDPRFQKILAGPEPETIY